MKKITIQTLFVYDNNLLYTALKIHISNQSILI